MTRTRWITFGLGLLIGLAVLSLRQSPVSHPAQAAAQTPVVINFDNLPAGGSGTTATVTVNSQYRSQGITFNGPVALDYSKGLPIPGFAHSGNIAIEQCYSQEFCFKPIEMTFTAPQRRVKVWAGYRGSLNEARTGLLSGFDAGGAEVARATATLPASFSSQPIRTALEITSSSENIVRATVSFSPGTIFTNGLAIDDVEFDTAGPGPTCPPTTTAPVVTLLQPASGETVSLNEFMLQGTISTPASAPLQAAILTVTGPGGSSAKPLDLLSSRLVSSSGGAFGPVRINDLLFPGTNTITITALNCRDFASSTRTITFVPIASAARVVLMGIEVTQAIQDLNNSVPLIADKRTLARVYLRLSGSTKEIRNVRGVLTACRPLTEGLPLCGDSLPIDPQGSRFNANLRSNWITINSSDDITEKRRDLNKSLNFELPPDWIKAGLLHLNLSQLEIVIPDPADPSREIGATPLPLPCDDCHNPNPTFPTLPRYYEFQNAPMVRLQLVSVPYITTDASEMMLTHTPRAADFNLLTSWLRRAYPTGTVEISPMISTSAFRGLPAAANTFTIKGLNFNCGDVNSRLGEMRIIDIATGGDDRRHYYGLVFGSGGFMQGCSGVPGSVASGPAGVPGVHANPANSAAWDFDGAYSDWYGGHEIGHSYGRDHPGSGCGESSDGPSYPYPRGMLSGPDLRYFGFDLGDASLGITRQVYAPDVWTDMMTYCSNEWISNYTYEGILARLRDIESGSRPIAPLTEEAAVQSSDSLLVQGTINLTRNSVALSPFLHLSGLQATPRPAMSSYSIDLLSSAGALLARYPFEPKKLTEISANEDQIGLLSEVVSYATGTSRIVITKDGTELASRTVSANLPQVKVLSPNGGEALSGMTATVNWQASDGDGDQLTYSLLYSTNAGQTWRTLAVRLTETSYQVSLADLPGSQRALFRVIATDGVNTGTDDSDAVFNVPLKSPRVSISAPANQSHFSTAQTAVFVGAASDLEDGDLDGAALQWKSDKQGALGSGHSIAVTGLMPGTHLITLEAKDAGGATGQASIQLQITATAPVADAGADRTVTLGSTVQLDGRNSRGLGDLTYQWMLLSKPAGSQAPLTGASNAQPTFVGDATGEYVAQLIIKDSTGAQAIDRIVVTVTCCALTIISQQDTGAALSASLTVITPALGVRTTPFTLSTPVDDRVTLTAPETIGNLRFLYWRSVTDNRVLTASTTLTGRADKTETLAAIYQLPQTVTLNIVSTCEDCATGPTQFPGLTVNLVSPALGNRPTPFNFDFTLNGRLILTAPATVTAAGKSLRFKHWLSVTDNRILTTHNTLSGHVDKSETLAAVYQTQVANVRLNVVSVCDLCSTLPLSFAGAEINVSSPALGNRATPFGFAASAESNLALKAALTVTIGGTELHFKHWYSLTEQRVLTTSPLLSGRADKAETLAAIYGRGSFLRIQAIRVADKLGDPTKGILPERQVDINRTQIRQLVDKANEVYASANIGLLFDDTEGSSDLLDLANPIINSMDGTSDKPVTEEQKRAANEEAAKYPGKVVFFFRWGSAPSAPTGVGFSWVDLNFVAMPGFQQLDVCGGNNNNLGLFPHELGHYLGLAHTFSKTFRSLAEAESYFKDQSQKVITATGDFNGDGKTDIIVFTRAKAGDVFVAVSDGTKFGPAQRWHDAFCFDDEIPAVGDFNGDGKDDIVTFTRGTAADVFVALSDGTKFVGAGQPWHSSFCFGDEIPAVGDFNGDGKDDIVTFTRGTVADVFVALSDGSKFVGTGQRWHDNFCFGDELPAIGDFNGDGKDDIATFTRKDTGDVFVALSSGQEFGAAARWHDNFCLGSEVPAIGDFDGDGKDDVITFTRESTADVFVALSEGVRFGPSVRWHDSFCFGEEAPATGDFNGDGKDDIVTFTRNHTGDVFAALSSGTRFAGTGVQWHENFDFSSVIFDGDGFTDTDPDPFIDARDYQCGPTPMSITLGGVEFRLPRTNVMSYYHPNSSVSTEVRTLSPQQINRIHEVIRMRFP